MFNSPTNSRANRFNGTTPPTPEDVFHAKNDDWLRGFKRRDRFAGAKRIGRSSKPWRKGAVFDIGDRHRRPLDRNDRARVLMRAEALERRTKHKHKRDGVLGQSGLAVLRCLVTYFQNRQSGRLDPGYDDIQRITGFCRQTIANAIKALERAGILEVMRRIVRERCRVWIEAAQQFFVFDRVVQTTNAYMINYPLPDRAEYGDLGAPLLRPAKYRPSESRFSTVPTSNFSYQNNTPPEKPLDPAVKTALDRLGHHLGIRNT